MPAPVTTVTSADTQADRDTRGPDPYNNHGVEEHHTYELADGSWAYVQCEVDGEAGIAYVWPRQMDGGFVRTETFAGLIVRDVTGKPLPGRPLAVQCGCGRSIRTRGADRCHVCRRKPKTQVAHAREPERPGKPKRKPAVAPAPPPAQNSTESGNGPESDSDSDSDSQEVRLCELTRRYRIWRARGCGHEEAAERAHTRRLH